MKCDLCGTEIQHSWESYGDVGETLCFDCMDELRTQEQGYEEIYGLAPHIHDMNLTGSIIGSTVLIPLEGKSDADGWYHIDDKTWFRPDTNPDGEGLGLWRYWL